MLSGSNPLVSGEDGLRVLEVLEAIKESVDGEKVVDVRRHLNRNRIFKRQNNE